MLRTKKDTQMKPEKGQEQIHKILDKVSGEIAKIKSKIKNMDDKDKKKIMAAAAGLIALAGGAVAAKKARDKKKAEKEDK